MKVKELIGTYVGNVIIERLVMHDDGNKYVRVYTGLMSLLCDSAIKDSEIVVTMIITPFGKPFLNIIIDEEVKA